MFQQNLKLEKRLAAAQAADLIRHRPVVQNVSSSKIRVNSKEYINFSSNDYLGFAHKIDNSSSSNSAVGSGASSLVTGYHEELYQLENQLATWLGAEKSLVFSSGFQANLAVMQTLPQLGDLILGDKLNHASLIDGALASDADFKRFPHLDYSALKRRLDNKEQDKFIVSDTIFSMDGDLADLAELKKLADQSNSWLYLDDAHGIGAFGAVGRGALDGFDLKPQDNVILLGTFGKAFGSSGAFVAGSKLVIDSLINFARPYIYSTAISPSAAAALSLRLEEVKQADKLRQKLQQNIDLFKQGLAEIGLPNTSQSAIFPLKVGDSNKALDWSAQLKKQGLWVGAIRPPTVPQNTARLRITLSASHSPAEIELLLEALAELNNR